MHAAMPTAPMIVRRSHERAANLSRPRCRCRSRAVLLLYSLLHTLAASAVDTFEFVGNGFCIDQQGRRLKLGPHFSTHAQDLQWKETTVTETGRARRCEQLCLQQNDCIGYMSEDARFCDIILRADHNAENGIAGADNERRNSCWERVGGAALDATGTCEVTINYEDGRPQEARECIALA